MKKVIAFIRKALLVLTLGTLAVLIGATVVLWQLADRTWWATLLAFGPRWVFLVPLGALLPVTVLFGAWRALGVWVLAAGVAAFGLLDVRVPWGAMIALDAPDDKPITVMTLNAEGDRKVEARVRQLVVDERVSLLAVEEWNASQSLAATLPGWNVVEYAGQGIASRYPLKLVEWLNFSDFALGTDGQLLRADMTMDKQVVHVYVLHLETPREGIEDWLGDKSSGGAAIERNTQARMIESAAARRYIDEVGGQFIVLGDFNLPVESRIYRRYWRAFKNAFSEGGWGLGHTKRTRRIGIRIDHVLCGGGCDVSSAHLGEDIGSDHLPLVGKLRIHPAADAE